MDLAATWEDGRKYTEGNMFTAVAVHTLTQAGLD